MPPPGHLSLVREPTCLISSPNAGLLLLCSCRVCCPDTAVLFLLSQRPPRSSLERAASAHPIRPSRSPMDLVIVLPSSASRIGRTSHEGQEKAKRIRKSVSSHLILDGVIPAHGWHILRHDGPFVCLSVLLLLFFWFSVGSMRRGGQSWEFHSPLSFGRRGTWWVLQYRSINRMEAELPRRFGGGWEGGWVMSRVGMGEVVVVGFGSDVDFGERMDANGWRLDCLLCLPAAAPEQSTYLACIRAGLDWPELFCCGGAEGCGACLCNLPSEAHPVSQSVTLACTE